MEKSKEANQHCTITVTGNAKTKLPDGIVVKKRYKSVPLEGRY
jgi:hypothetical protein